jgi:Polysaccharide lyase family 4, domain II/Copper binding proteins, plastocyanin/azurin family
MIGRIGVSWLIALVIVTAACSKPGSSSSSSAPSPDAAPAQPAAPSPGTANVTGQISGLLPGVIAFVMLEPNPARTFPPPADPPVMDQVGQTFGPPLLFVRTGHPVEFRNSDDTLHNVHVTNEDTREGAFNVAIPTGNSYSYTFKADGFYHVGCDIHPAMSAEVISTSTPYVTTAENDGRYVIEDVAPGTYTLTTYVEGRKTQRDIEVTAPQSRGTPSRE